MHQLFPGHGAGRRAASLLGAIAALIAGLVAASALAQPAAHRPASNAAAARPGQAAQTPAAQQPLPRTISRKCGRSKSSKRIRSRRSSRLRNGTIRTRYVYCSGRRVIRDTRQTVRTVPGATITLPGTSVTVPGPTQTVTGPTETVTGPTETVTGPTETVTGPTETVTTTVPVEVPEPPKPYRLTLLHNNDGESKMITGDSLLNYGGAARYKTRIDQLRAEAAAYSDADTVSGAKRKGTINVSSGDNFLAGLNYQGSVVAGRYYDAFAVARIGYDALTIGNHEFDFGPNRLADFIEDDPSESTFLTANLDFENEPRMDALADSGRVRHSTVIERGGDRIGVIGLTTPQIAFISSPGNTIIHGTDALGDQELADIVNAEVTDLEAQGVNKIIMSSHLQGIASEKALIPKLRGVDVVIAGGGDELLINPGQLKVNADNASGPYPDQAAQDADGRPVPVVTTQGEYRYVGRLMAEFDGDGHITSIDSASGPVRVSGNGADADVVSRNPQLVKEIDDPLLSFRAALDANIIATTDVHLDGRNSAGETIRRRETNLGNLVADAFWYTARRDAVAHGNPLPDVALTNGGGIRNSNVFPACPAFPGQHQRGRHVPRAAVRQHDRAGQRRHAQQVAPAARGRLPLAAGGRRATSRRSQA